MRKASPRCVARRTELTRGSSTSPLFTMNQPTAAWTAPSAKIPASGQVSLRGTRRRAMNQTKGRKNTTPMTRPSNRCAYSHQKIPLNPSSVMSWLRSRYSGVSRYFANASSHCESFSGGTAPTIGCHSTIESPECVRRVMPPTTIIAKTIAQQARSHAAMARSLGWKAAGESMRGSDYRRTSRRSGGLAQLRLVQLLQGEFPVEQAVDHRLHVVGTAVLVVDVVRVFPHVDREQRRRAHRDRCLRVGRRDHLELLAAGDEPCPAAAELVRGRGGELLLELLRAAERIVDEAPNRAGRLAAASF